MGRTTAWHYKASLTCYFPSYIVDTEEVLRALPVHILNGGRAPYARRGVAGTPPVRNYLEKIQPYAPKIPSPLRQSTRWMSATESTIRKRCSVSIGLLCILKRGVATPRRPRRGLNTRYALRTGLRKVAYTFAGFVERPCQNRKVAQSATSFHICFPDASKDSTSRKESCTELRKSKHARNEISALREELDEAKKRVGELRGRRRKLDHMEARSEVFQRRVQEQHDRLTSIFVAVTNDERKRWQISGRDWERDDLRRLDRV